MKARDLVRGMQPCEFGPTAIGSPLLKSLVTDAAGNPRWDSALWLFDKLRELDALVFDKVSGKWGPNAGGPTAKGGTPHEAAHEAMDHAIGESLAEAGGEAPWTPLKEAAALRLEVDTIKHWDFVRAMERLEDAGIVKRLKGRKAGYRLTRDGQELYAEAIAEAQLQREALEIALSRAEQDKLIARLPGPAEDPITGEAWFEACAGVLPAGRLLHSIQLKRMAGTVRREAVEIRGGLVRRAADTLEV